MPLPLTKSKLAKLDDVELAGLFMKSIDDDRRYRCLTDLFYLSTEILGYTDLTPRLHRPLCDLVQSVNPLIIEQAGDACLLRTILNKDNAASAPSSKNHTNPQNNNHHRGKSDCGVGGGGVEVCEGLQNSMQNFQINLHNSNTSNNLAISGNIEVPKSVLISDLGNYVTVGKNTERLFLMHRGGFKTTIVSIAHTIQLMLLWPDIRILLNSHKVDKGSAKILAAIRQHFCGNEKLRLLFPECVPQPDKTGKVEFGTQERVTMPNRTKGCPYPEATIEISGMTTDVTGRKFDYIKNDDMVTRESVTNETMIQKVRDIKALQKYLYNHIEKGITDNIGTIFHFNDLYADLKKKNITKVIMPIWDENENIIPYELFTKKGIDELRNEPDMDEYSFSCQMLLNPVPPESQTFRPEWLERFGFNYEQVELQDKPMRVAVYFDPANTKKKKSDFTAYIVIGIDNEGTKFLLDLGRDKLNVEERTNLVLDVCRKWKLHKVHYETIGFQDTDKYIIDRKMREQKYHIEVVEIKASQSSKEDRIRGLQPLYQRGNIRWPRKIEKYVTYEGKNVDMIAALRDEMMMFPKCIHDDMLDVHSFMLQVEEYNATKAHVAKTEDSFERLQKTLRPAPARKSYYKTGRPLRSKNFEVPYKKCVV